MSNAPRPIIATFVSASGGAGRTSTVANLAWVLSSAGRRVLVVDWGSEPPRVPEFLEPFFVDQVPMADETGRPLAAMYDAAELGSPFRLERFALPDTAGHIDVFAPLDPDGNGRARGGDPPSGSLASELHARLCEEDYDVVLIDAPTSETSAALALIAAISDVVAVCFSPRPRAITHAGALAKQLKQQVGYRTDLVPVATMFDRRYPPRADRSRALIRSAFADLVEDQAPRVQGDPTVEIPYQPYEAFDPLLAVLVEESGDDGAEPDLLTQYGRLAEAITAGQVTRMPRVSRGLQQRYRRIFGLTTSTEPDRVLIVYAPRDRAWADWARTALERAGAKPAFLREAPGWLDDQATEILVISSAKAPSAGRNAREWMPATLPGRAAAMLVEPDAVPPEGVTRWLNVADLSEAGARRRLLTQLGLIDRPDEPSAEPLRFPANKPSVRSRPRRHPRFVGREADLEELRDQMLANRVTTLCGPAGIGKSELALEYTYRFTGDYDLIWWVPSHDRESVQVSLAQLAERLSADESVDFQMSTEYGSTTPLDELSSGLHFKNWLLVYDNVDSPEVIRGLVPTGASGHVLITAGDSADVTLELGEMPLPDSVRLLVERVPGIDVEKAERVAAEVGNLPLTLQLAGSWLVETVAGERRAGAPTDRDAAAWAVQRFLERMSEEESRGLDVVARVVSVLVDSLRASAPGRNALLLAQLCSFLSTQGIDLRLIRSPAMIRTLVLVGGAEADPLALDSWELDHALWVGTRFGMFRVDWGVDSSLRIHRVVQKVLRAAMSADEQASRQARVLSALAAYAPIEVEETQVQSNRPMRYRELQKHVFVSGALDSHDPLVRRWLVNQLRFLYTDGGVGISLASTEPGHALLTSWTEKFGVDDPLANRLATQLANVERRIGNNELALKLDDTALVQQRRSLALTHPQTLMTARGRGGDLRGLGHFAEALDEDTATWEGVREIFGDDHPETRRVANNLAHSRYLAGDTAGALDLELDNFRRRRRLLGPDDRVTRWSQTKVGIFQRELGRYEEALASLHEAREKLQDVNDASGLATQWQLAIAERLGGSPAAAQRRTTRALNGFHEMQGRYHPDTIACTLSLANDHRMLNDAATAINLARQVVHAYRTHRLLPEDHPFLAIARLCLGSALCAQNELEEAESEVLAAVGILRDSLGDEHPWTLAAVVSQARASASLGRMSEAVELLGTAADDGTTYFGADHPATVIAAHNLALASGPHAQVDAGWRDIHVDIPQT